MTMTKEDKIDFINAICDHKKQRILDVVDKMPEEWDGVELREFIKDVYAEAVWKPMDKSSKMKYYNTILVEGLL